MSLVARGVSAAALSLMFVGGVAAAQTGGIAGTVLRDSTEQPLGETEVTVVSVNRTVRTSYLGEFRIDGIPVGAQVIVLRRVGYTSRTDTVEVKAGQVSDGEYQMRAAPVELGATKTVATAELEEPYLRDFNDRRKVGFGHFVTEDEVRKADNHNFANFAKGQFPGMSLVNFHGQQFLSSGRKACSGKAFECAPPVDPGGKAGESAPPGCYVSVYIDGIADYLDGVTRNLPTDFSNLKSEDFAAIEYYSSGATAPSQYNATGSDCGVLLLWRRHRIRPTTP